MFAIVDSSLMKKQKPSKTKIKMEFEEKMT